MWVIFKSRNELGASFLPFSRVPNEKVHDCLSHQRATHRHIG